MALSPDMVVSEKVVSEKVVSEKVVPEKVVPEKVVLEPQGPESGWFELIPVEEKKDLSIRGEPVHFSKTDYPRR